EKLLLVTTAKILIMDDFDIYNDDNFGNNENTVFVGEDDLFGDFMEGEKGYEVKLENTDEDNKNLGSDNTSIIATEELHTPDISDKPFSYSNEITGNDMLAALSEKNVG
ncbi:3067_t:CDS:2, partial [Entrophospora sp. SA101]